MKRSLTSPLTTPGCARVRPRRGRGWEVCTIPSVITQRRRKLASRRSKCGKCSSSRAPTYRSMKVWQMCMRHLQCVHIGIALSAIWQNRRTRAIALWRELQRRDPDNIEYRHREAFAEANQADALMGTNRVELAERAFRHAISTERELWNRTGASGNRHCGGAHTLALFGNFLVETKRDDE